MLGWSSKDQSRHYIDLAYIGRDYVGTLDADNAANLIRRKFAREAHGSGRYRHIRNLGELASTFSAPGRVKLIRDSWEEDLGTQVLFLPDEENRADSLTDFANVERFVNEVWVPILAEAARGTGRR